MDSKSLSAWLRFLDAPRVSPCLRTTSWSKSGELGFLNNIIALGKGLERVWTMPDLSSGKVKPGGVAPAETWLAQANFILCQGKVTDRDRDFAANIKSVFKLRSTPAQLQRLYEKYQELGKGSPRAASGRPCGSGK
jgi:hypothetical protein